MLLTNAFTGTLINRKDPAERHPKGGTLIFSYIRRFGPFLGFKIFFFFFWGGGGLSEK